MPREVFLLQVWMKYAEGAQEVRVKRYGDYVKLKARRVGRLYTIRLPPQKADEVISRLRQNNVNVVELE